jgi:hypothetical protein
MHCDENDAQPDSSAAATSTVNTTMHNPTAFHTAGAFLVLLVNDSEYSQSAGSKPIFSPSFIYLVSPGARRAPTPPRPPPYFLGGEYQKKKVACGDGIGALT